MKLRKILNALLFLFAIASVLLLLDLDNRKAPKKESFHHIAIFKFASRILLDEAENGVLEALKERGLVEGQNCNIKRYSAEGDMGTANSIAQNIINNRFDMVISISTPALQVMANANKDGKVLHIFCAVTDPYISGVGITGTAPHQHPPHLVGIGTYQPVEEAFEIAKKMNPNLKKVGTVWCPSEVCSEACVRLARSKSKELGIELIEMSVENTTQIFEAATSLTMRGIEALWLGGDNVVELGIDQLINAAGRAQIPLFTNNPYHLHGNALFGFGGRYFEVGKIAGNMAVDVLKGKPTSEIGVENVVPNYLNINADALNNMKVKWDIEAFQ
jgi:ABC-type uncharacterized transport system substrate-binding protein